MKGEVLHILSSPAFITVLLPDYQLARTSANIIDRNDGTTGSKNSDEMIVLQAEMISFSCILPLSEQSTYIAYPSTDQLLDQKLGVFHKDTGAVR